MKKALFLCFVFLAVSAQSESSLFIKSETHSFEQIKELAKQSNKLILVDVYAVWCGPCKLLEKDTFTNSLVIKVLNQNFVCYKANGEEPNGRQLLNKYNVDSYPTLLVLKSNGDIIKRMEGYIGPKGFLEEIKGEVGKYFSK